jgi:tetratricopeptide (TPR) repeat protein
MSGLRNAIAAGSMLLTLAASLDLAISAVIAPPRQEREKPSLAGVDELIQQGLAHNAAGRYEEAWQVYREAAGLAPDNAFVLYNLGTVLGMLRRYQEASFYLHDAVRLSPDLLPAWTNLGAMYNHLVMPAEALAAFRQVLRLNPQDAHARYQCGVNLLRLKRVAEASIEEQELRAMNPDLADDLLRQIISVNTK